MSILSTKRPTTGSMMAKDTHGNMEEMENLASGGYPTVEDLVDFFENNK